MTTGSKPYTGSSYGIREEVVEAVEKHMIAPFVSDQDLDEMERLAHDAKELAQEELPVIGEAHEADLQLLIEDSSFVTEIVVGAYLAGYLSGKKHQQEE